VPRRFRCGRQSMHVRTQSNRSPPGPATVSICCCFVLSRTPGLIPHVRGGRPKLLAMYYPQRSRDRPGGSNLSIPRALSLPVQSPQNIAAPSFSTFITRLDGLRVWGPQQIQPTESAPYDPATRGTSMGMVFWVEAISIFDSLPSTSIQCLLRLEPSHWDAD